MADFSLKSGDILPPIEAIIRDGLGAPVNLTGASIRLWWRNKETGAVRSGVGVIVDALKARVKYNWIPADTQFAAEWTAEWTARYLDGRELTAPNNGVLNISVQESLR